jgi:opacity protein-like surface antigen
MSGNNMKDQFMKNISRLTSAVAAVAVLGASAATATEGFYLGAAGMQSRFDSNNFDLSDVDNEDTGWKIIAGYRSSPNFAFESAYMRFGNSTAPSVALTGPYEAKANALAAFGLGIWPAGPVDLFLKAGAARIHAKGNVGAVNFSDKKIEFAYGAGLQFNLGRFGMRAEYEKFNTSVIGDLDVISIGANYTFGVQ